MANGQVPTLDLGARIRQARKDAGLTQFELAADIEQAPRTVQSWEGNERVPRTSALQRVALRTGKTVAWFYESGDRAA